MAKMGSAAIDARLTVLESRAVHRKCVPREVEAAFREAGSLVQRRTGSAALAERAAVKRAVDVAMDLAAGRSARPPLTVGGLLTVSGAAEFDRLLEWTWGGVVRLYTATSVPGTDGKVCKFSRQNNVQPGSPYLEMRKQQRACHAEIGEHQ